MVQLFDSWASHLSPQDFDTFAAPYIKRIIDSVRSTHPNLSIILYISGGGGLLERMRACEPTSSALMAAWTCATASPASVVMWPSRCA